MAAADDPAIACAVPTWPLDGEPLSAWSVAAMDKSGRIRAIREFLEYAKTFDGVWWATREEIADWYMKNHASHIS